MNYDFFEFFDDVYVNYVNDLVSYGCIIDRANGEIVCHSKKFAKSMLAAVMIRETHYLQSRNEYVYMANDMLDKAFDNLDDKFCILSKGKKKSIESLIKKHFSVIFRELSKCYPSSVIYLKNNVGIYDREFYAQRQYKEGHPIDVRRIKKLKEAEGIKEKTCNEYIDE